MHLSVENDISPFLEHKMKLKIDLLQIAIFLSIPNSAMNWTDGLDFESTTQSCYLVYFSHSSSLSLLMLFKNFLTTIYLYELLYKKSYTSICLHAKPLSN